MFVDRLKITCCIIKFPRTNLFTIISKGAFYGCKKVIQRLAVDSRTAA
jgi:hypothetical protein